MNSHKLLGLVFDEQLTWNLLIDEVCSKVVKGINLLKAIKIYLPHCARQSFYKSLIQLIVDYACVIWGATSQYNLHRILRLQKYAARVILNIKCPQDVPMSELFYKLNWMTTNQRIEYFTSILMFKIINKSSHNYLHNRFEYVKNKHQINTRSAANGNLSIPKLSSKTGQRSFQYRGGHAWNSLSADVRDYYLVKFKKFVAGTVCK